MHAGVLSSEAEKGPAVQRLGVDVQPVADVADAGARVPLGPGQLQILFGPLHVPHEADAQGIVPIDGGKARLSDGQRRRLRHGQALLEIGLGGVVVTLHGVGDGYVGVDHGVVRIAEKECLTISLLQRYTFWDNPSLFPLITAVMPYPRNPRLDVQTFDDIQLVLRTGFRESQSQSTFLLEKQGFYC